MFHVFFQDGNCWEKNGAWGFSLDQRNRRRKHGIKTPRPRPKWCWGMSCFWKKTDPLSTWIDEFLNIQIVNLVHCIASRIPINNCPKMLCPVSCFYSTNKNYATKWQSEHGQLGFNCCANTICIGINRWSVCPASIPHLVKFTIPLVVDRKSLEKKTWWH